MRRPHLLVLLILVAAPEVLADKTDSKIEEAKHSVRVGEFGDLSTLKFRGLEHFKAEELRSELESNLKVQAACRPTAALLPLVEQLEETLAEGYAHSGCPGAKVRVIPADGSSLLATIEEGPRYKAGVVRIEGVDQELADSIRRCLTSNVGADDSRRRIRFYRDRKPIGGWCSPDDDNNDQPEMLWVANEPTRSSALRLNEIRKAVASTLAIGGYPLARFDISIEPVDKDVADLQIHINELGSFAQLTNIEIRGLERHSRNELLNFMGMEEGADYDLPKLFEAYDRLQGSCRFWKHDLSINFPSAPSSKSRYAAPDASTTLVVALTEYTHVGKLGEPLSEKEEALRRAGLWASRFFEQQDWNLRLSCRVDSSDDSAVEGDITAILAPQDGVFVSGAGAYTNNNRRIPWKFSLVNSRTELGVTDAVGKRRWSIPRQFLPNMELRLLPGAVENGEYNCRFHFGCGVGNEKSEATVVELETCPVVWVHEAHREESQCEVNDGTLSVEMEYANMRIDVATGRVLEMDLWGDGTSYCSIVPIWRRDGEFERELKEFQKLPNMYKAQRPCASILDWGLEVVEQLSQEEPLVPEATMQLLRQFATSDLLMKIDAKSDSKQPKGWEFQTATGESKSGFSPAKMVPVGAASADYLFVRETWPWTIMRERAIRCAKIDSDLKAVEVEFRRALARDDVGPLACWTLRCLGYVKDDASIQWGLRKLSDGSFEREVEMLTTPDTGMMKVLKQVVPLVQSLPEQDTMWLCNLAGDELSGELHLACHLLRQLDATSDEALQTSLAELLRGEIRTIVEADLQNAAAKVLQDAESQD
ncbi:hypothetical protein [Aeoliella sp.]|uniref:hypothetical protein n=1 Tax=Aeoliella sp. TaxID=2795800 RepID=UPI003CCC3EB1